MTELILNLTVGVVVGHVTSWPANLPVGEGRLVVALPSLVLVRRISLRLLNSGRGRPG